MKKSIVSIFVAFVCVLIPVKVWGLPQQYLQDNENYLLGFNAGSTKAECDATVKQALMKRAAEIYGLKLGQLDTHVTTFVVRDDSPRNYEAIYRMDFTPKESAKVEEGATVSLVIIDENDIKKGLREQHVHMSGVILDWLNDFIKHLFAQNFNGKLKLIGTHKVSDNDFIAKTVSRLKIENANYMAGKEVWKVMTLDEVRNFGIAKANSYVVELQAGMYNVELLSFIQNYYDTLMETLEQAMENDRLLYESQKSRYRKKLEGVIYDAYSNFKIVDNTGQESFCDLLSLFPPLEKSRALVLGTDWKDGATRFSYVLKGYGLFAPLVEVSPVWDWYDDYNRGEKPAYLGEDASSDLISPSHLLRWNIRFLLSFNDVSKYTNFTIRPLGKNVFPGKKYASDALPVKPGFSDILGKEKADGGDEDKIYDKVEAMPSFQGGEVALMLWLNEHVLYPAMAQENGVEGRVIVQFVVGRDGSVRDVKVVRSVDPSLDQEALRLVRAMPRWIPGKQDGKSVNCKFTLPVTFRLQ